MIAFVRSVTSCPSPLPSKLYVTISGSAKTGVAPAYVTAKTVAIKVLLGTITSSPFPIPNAFNDKYNASNPLPTPTQHALPIYAANSLSKTSTSLPCIYQFFWYTSLNLEKISSSISLCIS